MGWISGGRREDGCVLSGDSVLWTMASIHAHTNNIMTFRSCDRTACASPTHRHHGGIFNPFFLQAGRCHSARPSSNPSVGTLSKICVKLTQRKKILPCLFCLSFLLCYVVESLLRNQSGFFLTCLDIFLLLLNLFSYSTLRISSFYNPFASVRKLLRSSFLFIYY